MKKRKSQTTTHWLCSLNFHVGDTCSSLIPFFSSPCALLLKQSIRPPPHFEQSSSKHTTNCIALNFVFHSICSHSLHFNPECERFDDCIVLCVPLHVASICRLECRGKFHPHMKRVERVVRDHKSHR